MQTNDITDKLFNQLFDTGISEDAIINCFKSCINALNNKQLIYSDIEQLNDILTAMNEYVSSKQLLQSINVYIDNLVLNIKNHFKNVKNADDMIVFKKDSKEYKELHTLFINAFRELIPSNEQNSKQSSTKQSDTQTSPNSKRDAARKRIARSNKATTELDDDVNHITYDDVLEASEYPYPELYTTFRYLYVRQGKFIGIWLATCNRDKWNIKRLTNYDIQLINIVSPVSSSKNVDYILTLRITDIESKTYTIVQNKEQRRTHDLEAYVKPFGIYPTSLTDKQHLDSAIQHLGLQTHISKQLSVETLGLHEYNGKRLWVTSNGCEAIDGFKEGLDAPFLLDDDSNIYDGYVGCTVNAPKDDILRLMFEKSNIDENVQCIDDALLAYTVVSEYYDRPKAGTMPFALEILGCTRKGKTTTVNRHQSAYGIGFNYRHGTLLNNVGGVGKGDSALGACINLSKLKYVWGTDYDHSKKPTDDRFKDEYTSRVAKNAMYADDAHSTVSTKNQKSKHRPKQTGGLIRTGETDFAKFITDSPSSEYRVCTFVWGDVTNDEIVSKAIDEKRVEYYAWHVYFRKWQFSKSTTELAEYWKACADTAYDLCPPLNEWYGIDLHKQQTELLVTGLLIWKKFLEEWFPDSFMINTIDMRISRLILNRVTRCKYITYDIKQEQVSNIADQTIDILRKLLHHGTGYIKTEKDLFITLDYINEHNLNIHAYQVGYKEDFKNGKKTFSSMGDVYGYFVKNATYLALHTDIVIASIQTYASRNNIKIGTSDDILTALEQAGYIQTYVEKTTNKKLYATRSRIAGKQRWLLTIPLTVLFPVTEDGEIFNNEDIKVVPDNIIDIDDHRTEEVTEDTDTIEPIKPVKKARKKPIVKPSIKTEQTLEEMLKGDIV